MGIEQLGIGQYCVVFGEILPSELPGKVRIYEDLAATVTNFVQPLCTSSDSHPLTKGVGVAPF